ncbi:U-scoloptoxin(19)-Sm1a [Pararge aegeria]|uniref:Jg4768 protein n=1 Tax=Pararge aegeria aegeria TaxID=348720 RepID=A0A8S4R5K8_9NEOP|nr:U-scoloptoxin(19)-Sm1a [Pararge aegeria]CAH2232094.1 jg4768 [Pararge aegeria aegeria]
MKIVLLVIVLVGVVIGNQEDLRIIDSIVQEQPCIEMGGICTVSEDCPKGHLAEKQGLCPTQRKQGIDCCHGVSMKETRCAKHGGSCMTHETYCNPRLIFDDAKDCPQGHHCCIMVL